MKTHLFRVECLTDLHVGSGEANYSIIDNEVQKDTVLQDVPIINASGVKGALKEHFERLWGKNNKDILKIFGGDEESEAKNKKTKEGEYKFFSALCIARPLRVTNGNSPYILATSGTILDHFSKLFKGLGLTDAYIKNIIDSPPAGESIEVEGVTITPKVCSLKNPLIDSEFAVIENLSDYALPVRARNVLDDNGLSKNLWYEELVPHKSIFLFAVITSDDECLLEFDPDRPVQFGGNASIGNGYTVITEVESHE